jgi:hypothetical protein
MGLPGKKGTQNGVVANNLVNVVRITDRDASYWEWLGIKFGDTLSDRERDTRRVSRLFVLVGFRPRFISIISMTSLGMFERWAEAAPSNTKTDRNAILIL